MLRHRRPYPNKTKFQPDHDLPMRTPLHDYLSAIDFPWNWPRSSLEKRFGIRQHAAYNWDVVEIPTPRVFVRGLLWPLSTVVRPEFSTVMPATEFSGNAYFGIDARDNLRLTVEQLARVLGEGTQTETSNTLGHEWTFGPASVELNVWPPDMQRFSLTNPAHSREPRLKAACSIGIKTGYRPLCSVEDKALIASFVPVARMPGDVSAMSRNQRRPASQRELEFIRLPDEDVGDKAGWLGRSATHSALISFSAELYIVPMEDVVQLEVARVRPAKGPGGSWLLVQCRSKQSQERTKTLTLCGAEGPDDLSKLAADIADALGKPLVLQPYQDNY
jgi:hypothetical protein